MSDEVLREAWEKAMQDRIVPVKCPKSRYRDDRHEWDVAAYERGGGLFSGPTDQYTFEVWQCLDCEIVVLLSEHPKQRDHDEKTGKYVRQIRDGIDIVHFVMERPTLPKLD